jgi:hypothetical protein
MSDIHPSLTINYPTLYDYKYDRMRKGSKVDDNSKF